MPPCKDRASYSSSQRLLGAPLHNDGLPVCVAIDADRTYKHRIRRTLATLFPQHTVPLEEAGAGVSAAACVEIEGNMRTIPIWKCVVTGDAKHVSLGAQRHVRVFVRDARQIKLDINEAVMRWTKPIEQEVAVGMQAPAQHHWQEFPGDRKAQTAMTACISNQAYSGGSGPVRKSLREFLEQPWVQQHPAWTQVLGMPCEPPRRTLQSLARHFGADLHVTSEAHGWSTRAQFITEASLSTSDR